MRGTAPVDWWSGMRGYAVDVIADRFGLVGYAAVGLIKLKFQQITAYKFQQNTHPAAANMQIPAYAIQQHR